MKPTRYRGPLAKPLKPRLRNYVEYTKLKRTFLEDYKKCMNIECSQRATEIHHYRGRLKNLLTDTTYFIGLCAKCHRKVHDNPDWARSVGLLCAKGDWNQQPKD